MEKAKDQQAGYVASSGFGLLLSVPSVKCLSFLLVTERVTLQWLMNLLTYPTYVMLQVSRGKSSTGPLDSHVPPRGLVTSFSQLPLF